MDGDDPTTGKVPDTFKQHYAGTVVGREREEPKLANNNEQVDQPEPMPVELKRLLAWFDRLNHDRVTAGFTVGIFFATAIYALVAIAQWRAMRESNDINRAALQSVQRAFVLPGAVDPTVIGPKGVQSAMFALHWDNSGSTPARGTTHVNYRWDQTPLPEDFSFPDLWTQDPQIDTPFILGPRGTTSVQVGPIPTAVIDGAVQHRIHLNFWGWAAYRDVFKNTPEHVTQFCYELIPIDVELTKDGLTTVKYQLNNCSHHNCYDEECRVAR